MRILTLDLQFQGIPQAIAAYVVQSRHGSILIESGPASTLPTLLESLRGHGIEPDAIGHLFVTHIHLDHAGAAGWWARRGTRVYVHRRGAPHLVDPSKLLASAGRIYGDQMDRLWGRTEAAPADQVIPLNDGDRIEVAGLEVTAVETPGHARHHHAFRCGDVCFSGDVGGIASPDHSLIDLPTPPPEFDREAWLTSLDRLEREQFAELYPTHFGRVSDPRAHLSGIRSLLGDVSRLVRRGLEAGHDERQIAHDLRKFNMGRAREAGLDVEQLTRFQAVNPATMSASGMIRYWRRRLG